MLLLWQPVAAVHCQDDDEYAYYPILPLPPLAARGIVVPPQVVPSETAAAVLVAIRAIGSYLDLDTAAVVVEAVVVCCQICNQQMRRRRTAKE